MADQFEKLMDTVTAAARAPFAIVPSDADELPVIPKRIYVGSGGNVTLRGVGAGADVVYKNVGDGVYLNVRPSFIRATGTTAADIIGEA